MKSLQLQILQRRMIRWYRRSGRRLPWRRTRNPYKTLVSEIMLQQTQVNRVLEHYPGFLRKFPGFAALANASGAGVLRAWAGMGYNNRAVRLRSLARIVLNRHNGRLPSDIDELRSLPGIGRYTAHAIACFAFGAEVPVVETNIARVLSRLYPGEGDTWKKASLVLPRRQSYLWNQALMDFGAAICTPASPKCLSCPLKDLCPSAFRIARQKNLNPRKEPGRGGIPNRIYRGRIVRALRSHNGRTAIPSRKLGSLIKDHFTRKDERWLLNLLTALENDGVVRVRRNANRTTVSFVE